VIAAALPGRAQNDAVPMTQATGDGRHRAIRAIFLVLGKFPETQGALRYWRLRSLRRSGPLIEYK